MSINWDYVKERVLRYNEKPSDDLLYRIGSHADVLEPGESSDGILNPEQRFRILNWICSQKLKIKHDLALLIFGSSQLDSWLQVSRGAYPNFEFYLVFEFLEEEDTGWESQIYYTLFWHPNHGAPMPDIECDFPWKLDWELGEDFWGSYPDNCTNDFDFTLACYPNQSAFAQPGYLCCSGDRYTTESDEEALMSVAEVLQACVSTI